MIRSDVYKEILNEYKNKNLITERELEKRKIEVYEKKPELENIHRQLGNLGFTIAKKIMISNDPEKLIDELKGKQEDLLKREKMILQDENFPEDYLEQKYFCDKCKDTGFIDKNECICFKQSIIEKYYGMSNIKNILDTENFDNFNISYFSKEINKEKGISPFDNMRHAYKVSTEFVNNFPHVFQNIFFYGPTGRGKTFLCNCIAKDILDKGYSVVYLTAPDFFRTFENYRFHRDEMNRPEYYISLITDCDLLIIDDLGTEVSTAVTISELFNVVNSRILKEKHTIISTNLALNDIEKYYSHRLESRIVGSYSLLDIFGDDIRIQKKFRG